MGHAERARYAVTTVAMTIARSNAELRYRGVRNAVEPASASRGDPYARDRDQRLPSRRRIVRHRNAPDRYENLRADKLRPGLYPGGRTHSRYVATPDDRRHDEHRLGGRGQ